MTRKIIITNDGAHSIFSSQINESYHSKHGSIVEAEHVFIKHGLLAINKKNINILEIGFGTGLNALLSLQKSIQKNININYHAIELYPITKDEYLQLNFPKLIGMEKSAFNKLHESEWEKKNQITKNFKLTKYKISIEEFKTKKSFDIIYFDAFSPEKQPELWTKKIFSKMYSNLKSNGFIVTYCAKGIVKRTLKEIGFEVLSLDGPPGKRQMTKANRK